MAWETRDVMMLVVSIGGVAAAWGVAQSKVAALAATVAKLEAALTAELRELKRDTGASLKDQGRRLGEIEVATKIAREIAKLQGRGTPALGTVFDRVRRGEQSGQVSQQVEDGSSSDDNEGR